MDNPFAFVAYGRKLITYAATDRIGMIRRSTDPEWLKRVIEHDGSQSTVKQAASARLCKLGVPAVSPAPPPHTNTIKE